jgi:hypothetical protein
MIHNFSGLVFTKNSALIHMLENLMNSSRTIIQKPALVVIFPALQLLCVAMAMCVNLIRKHSRSTSLEVNKYNLNHIFGAEIFKNKFSSFFPILK